MLPGRGGGRATGLGERKREKKEGREVGKIKDGREGKVREGGGER